MNTISVDSALNPTLGRTRAGERPLSNREQLQRAAALCAANSSGPNPKCTGAVFVGMFFDGTGNNEQKDYLDTKSAPRKMKHSNVVRLYHAHPNNVKIGTNGYYKFYVPGVGTPFPQIGDTDGETDEEGSLTQRWHQLMQTLGSTSAMNGAPRIVWGLTRVFNAISRHVYREDLIDDEAAKGLANGFLDVLKPQVLVDAGRLALLVGYWQNLLRAKLAVRPVKVEMVTVNVFGFSRGAAEARTFVHWLYQLCSKDDGGYTFAGIPLRVQFLGIFDTVASVGLAGLYTFIEGRAGWANDTMQVHPGVEQCVHMVAGTEARACFPLDSVRIEGKYPANVIEYVYPGSHSDVGGGYKPLSLGRANWSAPEGDTKGIHAEDLQLARVPGYEMYCAALRSGVPLQTEFGAQKVPGVDIGLGAFKPLTESVAKDLKPSAATVKAFDAYFEKAAIQVGPVEEMARQHLSLYFTYRVRHKDWRNSPAMKRSEERPNGSAGVFKEEPLNMRKTQWALVFVLAALCDEIEHRIQGGSAQPAVLRQRYDAYTQAKGGLVKGLSEWTPCSAALAMVGPALTGFQERQALMAGSFFADDLQKALDKARNAPQYLARWRAFLSQSGVGDVRDVAVERDGIRLLEAVRAAPVPPEVEALLEDLVHDSMAGFIGFGMPEFETNGYGLAKFRRIFFGNRGDEMLREQVERSNKQQVSAFERKAAKERAQQAQWEAESREFQRTQVRSR